MEAKCDEQTKEWHSRSKFFKQFRVAYKSMENRTRGQTDLKLAAREAILDKNSFKLVKKIGVSFWTLSLMETLLQLKIYYPIFSVHKQLRSDREYSDNCITF